MSREPIHLVTPSGRVPLRSMRDVAREILRLDPASWARIHFREYVPTPFVVPVDVQAAHDTASAIPLEPPAVLLQRSLRIGMVERYLWTLVAAVVEGDASDLAASFHRLVDGTGDGEDEHNLEVRPCGGFRGELVDGARLVYRDEVGSHGSIVWRLATLERLSGAPFDKPYRLNHDPEDGTSTIASYVDEETVREQCEPVRGCADCGVEGGPFLERSPVWAPRIGRRHVCNDCRNIGYSDPDGVCLPGYNLDGCFPHEVEEETPVVASAANTLDELLPLRVAASAVVTAASEPPGHGEVVTVPKAALEGLLATLNAGIEAPVVLSPGGSSRRTRTGADLTGPVGAEYAGDAWKLADELDGVAYRLGSSDEKDADVVRRAAAMLLAYWNRTGDLYSALFLDMEERRRPACKVSPECILGDGHDSPCLDFEGDECMRDDDTP